MDVSYDVVKLEPIHQLVDCNVYVGVLYINYRNMHSNLLASTKNLKSHKIWFMCNKNILQGMVILLQSHAKKNRYNNHLEY